MDIRQHIHNNALVNIDSMIPKDGETFIFKGGIGNRVLKQVKNENGKFYECSVESGEWKEFDMTEKILRFIEKIRSTEEKPKRKKFLGLF